MRAATSSSLSTSNANSIRRTLPNVLISSGTFDPFGFSKNNAGPTLCAERVFERATRCATSVISKTGSTSARTRFSSPSFSSLATNSRKSRYPTHASPSIFQIANCITKSSSDYADDVVTATFERASYFGQADLLSNRVSDRLAIHLAPQNDGGRSLET